MISEIDRSSAFRAARHHSLLVKFLRIALPLGALGFASFYILNSKLKTSLEEIGATVESIEMSSKHLKMVNPRMEGFNEKNGKYLLTAKSALQNIKDPSRITLDNIDAKITDPENGWYHILAKSGTFFSKKEFLKLYDGIHVTSVSGVTAKLEKAEIDMKNKIITSTVPVVVEMSRGQVHGNNMHLNFATHNVLFGGGVQMHIDAPPTKAPSKQPNSNGNKEASSLLSSFAVSGDQPIDITSRRLAVFDDKKQAHFLEDVIAVQEAYRLKAEKMVVYYSAGDEPLKNISNGTNIRRIEAQQTVRIETDNGQNASADQLVFNALEETLFMSGHVLLRRGLSELQSSKLFVNLKTGKSIFGPGGRVVGHFRRPGDVPPAVPAGATAIKKGGKKVVLVGSSVVNLTSTKGHPINVEANKLVLDDQTGRAIFSGRVITTQGGYRLTSDLLTLHYARTSKSRKNSANNITAEKIEAKGHVSLLTPDKQIARSQWALYNVKANKMTIGGNAVLTQNGNVMKGDRLIIDLTSGRSHFESLTPDAPRGKRVRALFMPKQVNQLKKERAKGQ